MTLYYKLIWGFDHGKLQKPGRGNNFNFILQGMRSYWWINMAAVCQMGYKCWRWAGRKELKVYWYVIDQHLSYFNEHMNSVGYRVKIHILIQ